jgi:hypothetical protein
MCCVSEISHLQTGHGSGAGLDAQQGNGLRRMVELAQGVRQDHHERPMAHARSITPQ